MAAYHIRIPTRQHFYEQQARRAKFIADLDAIRKEVARATPKN